MVKENLRVFLKTLMIQVVITTGLLLALAFLILQMGWEDVKWKTGIMLIYGVAGFCGGMAAGSMSKNKRYLKGLAAGLFYFAVWFLAGAASGSRIEETVGKLWSVCGICGISGLIGGMLAGILGGNKNL